MTIKVENGSKVWIHLEMAWKQFRIILRGDMCEIYVDDRRKFNTLMDSRNYIFSAILIKQNHTKWEQS
jgi:hypothetical protein